MSLSRFRDLAIPARDGYPLAGRIYEGSGSGSGPRRVVVIHAATSVPQKIYAAFAKFLAENGFVVVTYDYRGIAGSRDRMTPFREFKVTMMDWARLDADGVHDWVAREYPAHGVGVVGHSFGGQCLGLLENRDQIKRAVLVASQNGYWRFFSARNWPFMIFNWYVLFPMCLFALGYIPMRRLGQGEDLPGGVARQWRRWCLTPEYLFSELTEEQKAAYRNFRAPILALAFTDDHFAGGKSVQKLLERYPADARLREVAPRDLDVKKIGHFGFFKPKFRDSLWTEALEWLRR